MSRKPLVATQAYSRFGIAALLLCSCGESTETAEDWELIEAEHDAGLLLSAWGQQADELFVVGGRPERTAILFGSAESLRPIDNPGRETAWWVCGVEQGVIVVGERGLVLRGDAAGFELLDIGIDATLYGCSGSSFDDFWVVGGNPATGPPQLAQVVDGVALAPDLGALVPQLPNALFKIELIDDAVFVVGEAGTILMRAADEWSLQQPTEEPLFTVAGAATDDVWVVGGLTDAYAAHFDGSRWRERSPARQPNLFGVHSGPNGVTAVGAAGAILELPATDPDAEWEAAPILSQDTFHAVWQAEDGSAIAVGGNVLEQIPEDRHGLIAIRR